MARRHVGSGNCWICDGRTPGWGLICGAYKRFDVVEVVGVEVRTQCPLQKVQVMVLENEGGNYMMALVMLPLIHNHYAAVGLARVLASHMRY